MVFFVFKSCIPIMMMVVRIILWFYAILRVLVMYSHYGDGSSSIKLNGHQALNLRAS